jgi:hypothetical protein
MTVGNKKTKQKLRESLKAWKIDSQSNTLLVNWFLKNPELDN